MHQVVESIRQGVVFSAKFSILASSIKEINDQIASGVLTLNGVDEYFVIPEWNKLSSQANVTYETDNDDGFIVDASGTVTEIGRVGSNYHTGTLTALKLEDPTFIQDGRFMWASPATTRGGLIPVMDWDNFRASFETILTNANGGGWQHIFFGGSLPDQGQFFFGITGGSLRVGFAQMFNVADADFSFVNGVAYKIAVEVRKTGNDYEISYFVDGVPRGTGTASNASFVTRVAAIGRSRSLYTNTLVANLLFENLDNENEYVLYTNKNGDEILKDSGPLGRDGVWQESDVDMLPLDAYNARTYYPPIDRTFDFSKVGEITYTPGETNAQKLGYDLDHLLIVGASIMRGCWTDQKDSALAALQKNNVNVGFKSYAVSGDTINNAITRFATAATEFSGVSNVGVLIHIGGNNVTANGDWDTWTQTEKDTFTSGLTQLLDNVVAAGFQPILMPLTYRNYDGTGDDSRSRLVNENLVYPLIQSYSPDWWDGATGKPIIDIWQWTHDNFSSYTGGTDAVHGSPEGYGLLTNYIAEKIASNKGTVTTQNVRGDIISFYCLDSQVVAGGNTISAIDANLTNLVKADGGIIGGSSAVFSNFTGLSNSGITGPVTSIYQDAKHYGVTNGYIFAQLQTGYVDIALGAAYAGKTGVARITAARSGTSELRITKYTIGDKNGYLDPTDTSIPYLDLPFTLGSNGEMQLEVVNGVGDQHGYLSGLSLYLDEPVQVTMNGIDSSNWQ